MTPQVFGRMSVVVVAVATLLLAPAARGQDEIPLLPEDRPSDLEELNLGPWTGSWVIESQIVGGVEVTTYFCSEERAGLCLGNEYVADPLPPICIAGCRGPDCSGPCEGESTTKKSKYAEACTTDADCPIDDGHETCDDAKSDAKGKADDTCKEKGGADCVCYAHSKVTAKSGKCRQGALAKYCKYSCTAKAKGNCAKEWTAVAVPLGGTP